MGSYHRRRSHPQPSVRCLLYFSHAPHPVVRCWHAVSTTVIVQAPSPPFLRSIYSLDIPNIQEPTYFNRADVKKAIHAPLDVDWVPCTRNVFNTSDGNDESLPPAFTVLPSVIERNLRTVIVHGMADYILIAEGFVYLIFLSYFIYLLRMS